MSDKEKKVITVLFVLGIVFTIIGSTLAYWSWQTTDAQKTNVTFTISRGFSCSADGGGNITSNDKKLAPAHCTNSTYAIKRTVTVGPTITSGGDVYLDLWLKVNNIGTELAKSVNMKYALTTSGTDCTTGVVAEGDFYGAAANTQKLLLHNKAYSQTTTDTYYLWIWLDSAETNNATQNQPFNIELGGSCTNQAPTTYSGTIYRYSNTYVQIGQRLVLQQKQAWCAISTEGNTCDYGMSWETQSECENFLTENNVDGFTCEQGTVEPISYETNPTNLNKTFYLKHVIVDDITTESYVGFIVTPAMATANQGMTAGTYYLHGLDIYDGNGNCKSQYLVNGNCESPYYESNKTVLQSAFGTNTNYCTDSSSGFVCSVSGLRADALLDGHVGAHDDGVADCGVYYNGYSSCD